MNSRRKQGFLRAVRVMRDEIPDLDAFPFSIPALRDLVEIDLDPRVTFFIGENGSGKSTLVEAIAMVVGFNPEGGSRNFKFSTRSSESELHRYLRPVRGVRRPRDGFFLRAESYFNVGTEIEKLDEDPFGGPPIVDSIGGVSVHEQSHGESFLSLVKHRFRAAGLYLLDEPEAALSVRGQLSLLRRTYDLVEQGSQFIVSTHSPILLAFPGATIMELSGLGVREVDYTETENYQLTQAFLANPERFLRHLFQDEE